MTSSRAGGRGLFGGWRLVMMVLLLLPCISYSFLLPPPAGRATGGAVDGRRPRDAVVLHAKKSLDAAKAAALAALEELEKLEAGPMAAAAAPAVAPGKVKDKAAKKAAKEAKKAQEKEENKNLKQAMDPATYEQPQGGGGKKKKKEGGGGGKKGAKGEEDDDAPAATTIVAEEAVKVVAAVVEEEKKEEEVVVQEVTLEERVRASRPPPRIRIEGDIGAAGTVFLRLEGVSMIFRNQEVIKDASWSVQAGERVGLVGPNGAGKTTMLKILSGELEPTTGEVVKSQKEMRIALLRQEFTDELQPERTLKDELLSVFKEEQAIITKLAQLEKDLEGATSDPEAMESILQELGKTQEEADRKQVYGLPTRVEKIMDSMGFVPNDADMPVKSFSGGWKMRIGLGKVLLQDPGVLMLDEPTNHLDLDSVEWLEDFLRRQSLPMVIVSHDREFLDRVCTKIVDSEGGETVSYNGNYSNFLKQKKTRMEAWQKAYDNQQKKIQEEKEFINRFKSQPARAAQVKSREASLEKMLKGPDAIKRPPYQGAPFRFRFPPGPRLSGEVITIEDITHGYGNSVLLDGASLTISKGDRVAVIGPNGVGKSTLLRLIMGMEKPIGGKITVQASNAALNYFEQNQADALDLDRTVDATVMEASKTESYNELRSLMAQFMFKGDAIQKTVRQLSGGEKARVALCRMMLTPGNVLCLDEPTNHLDIPAKEILEEACRNYDGAIIMISHDRYFVSQVANRVVAVEDKKLVVYEGDYRFYMEKNEEMKGRMEKRYVDGTSGILSAPKLIQEGEEKKKSFGGKGGPSGRSDKGIKNAKRMTL